MSEVVHEMRNQLAIAVANVEAIADGKIAPTRERLSAILQALAHLDVLIASVNAPEPRPPAAAGSGRQTFDVCSIIKNEALAVEPLAAQKQLSISTHYCSGKHAECEVFAGDPVKVGQLVKNLLINAIHYTPKGGSIGVDCHRSPGEMVLEISDTGPGVAAGETEQIFSAGYRGTASAAEPGDGIGLSVVKRIAEQHGGGVTVHNNTAEGATFTVVLPGSAIGGATCKACHSAPSFSNGAS